MMCPYWFCSPDPKSDIMFLTASFYLIQVLVELCVDIIIMYSVCMQYYAVIIGYQLFCMFIKINLQLMCECYNEFFRFLQWIDNSNTMVYDSLNTVIPLVKPLHLSAALPRSNNSNTIDYFTIECSCNTIVIQDHNNTIVFLPWFYRGKLTVVIPQ